MKKCTLAWGIAALMLLVCAGLVYKFIFQGSANMAADGRYSIVLTAEERNLVLQEMRAFLESVQKITEGAIKKDISAISTAARVSGKAAAQGVPGTLMGKLPIEFKSLGLSTHDAFDTLALNAEQMNDATVALEQLAELMKNCVACHSAFRIDTEAAQ